MKAEQRSAQARAAAMKRHAPDSPDSPVTARLQTEFRAQRLAEHIKKIVDAAPPLTPEQRDRLALLLRGTS